MTSSEKLSLDRRKSFKGSVHKARHSYAGYIQISQTHDSIKNVPIKNIKVKNFMDPLEVPIDQARGPSTMAENRRFMNFFV